MVTVSRMVITITTTIDKYQTKDHDSLELIWADCHDDLVTLLVTV